MHELVHVAQNERADRPPPQGVARRGGPAERQADSLGRTPRRPTSWQRPEAAILRQPQESQEEPLPNLLVVPDPGKGKIRVLVDGSGLAEITPAAGENRASVWMGRDPATGEPRVMIAVPKGSFVAQGPAYKRYQAQVIELVEPRLQVEGGETKPATQGGAVPPPAPAKSLAGRLVQWHAAGRLDPGSLPPGVAPIPPMPVTPEMVQAEPQLAGLPAVAVAAEAARQAPRWVPVVIEGAAQAPKPAPTPSLFGRFLGPVGIGLTILLTPSSTAPPWMDTLSPITGKPYSSPEEYDWTWRLSQEQRDYLRKLEQGTAPAPAPGQQPAPAPQPREDEQRKNCFQQNPGAIACSDIPQSRDEVAQLFLMDFDQPYELGECGKWKDFAGGDVDHCSGAPGQIWHCDALLHGKKAFTVSVFGCLCCRKDGSTGFEWRGAHESTRLGRRGG